MHYVALSRVLNFNATIYARHHNIIIISYISHMDTSEYSYTRRDRIIILMHVHSFVGLIILSGNSFKLAIPKIIISHLMYSKSFLPYVLSWIQVIFDCGFKIMEA